MAEVIRFKGDVNSAEIQWLPKILSLMMVRDAIVAANRWYSSVRNLDDASSKRDLTISVVCTAGWVAEAALMLRSFSQTDHPYIAQCMTAGTEYEQAWSDYVDAETAIPLVEKLRRARNKYFAHWDDRTEIAPPFLSAQQSLETARRSPVATMSDERAIAIRYDLAQGVYQSDLFEMSNPGEPEQMERARAIARSIGIAAEKVAGLIDTLIYGAVRANPQLFIITPD